MSVDETNRPSQSDGSERITAENMALLCRKNVKLDMDPIQIPDTTVRQVGLCYYRYLYIVHRPTRNCLRIWMNYVMLYY